MNWPRIVRRKVARGRLTSTLDRKAESYEALAGALARLAPDPPPLSSAQISRIEAKVFSDMFGGSSPLPDPAQSRSRILVEGPVESAVMADYHPPHDRFRETEMIALDPGLQELTLSLGALSGANVHVAAGVQPRGLAGGLVALAITLSLTATAFAVAPSSGGPFRPLRLASERLHLALANNPLERAEVLMDIASHRLESLFSSPRFRLISLSEEMDSAGLEALALLKSAPPSDARTSLIVDLLGLGRSEQRHLQILLKQPPGSIQESLVSSLRTADLIVASMEELLIPYIAEPINGPISWIQEENPNHHSPRKVQSRTPRGVTPDVLRIQSSTGADLKAPSGEEDPQDTGPPCELTQGQLCINLPIGLP